MKEMGTLSPLYACVLIGGQSSRMGRPKHLIKNEDGLTWLESTVLTLKKFTDNIVLSGAGEIPQNIEGIYRVTDVPGVSGPISGILSAMRWNPAASWLLVACDMPKINEKSIQWLLDQRNNEFWGVVPILEDNGFVEPLQAYYDFRCKDYFEQLVADGCWKIGRVSKFPKMKTPIIPKELREMWANINYPEEIPVTIQKHFTCER